jgi:hypothetical protein
MDGLLFTLPLHVLCTVFRDHIIKRVSFLFVTCNFTVRENTSYPGRWDPCYPICDKYKHLLTQRRSKLGAKIERIVNHRRTNHCLGFLFYACVFLRAAYLYTQFNYEAEFH